MRRISSECQSYTSVAAGFFAGFAALILSLVAILGVFLILSDVPWWLGYLILYLIGFPVFAAIFGTFTTDRSLFLGVFTIGGIVLYVSALLFVLSIFTILLAPLLFLLLPAAVLLIAVLWARPTAGNSQRAILALFTAAGILVAGVAGGMFSSLMIVEQFYHPATGTDIGFIDFHSSWAGRWSSPDIGVVSRYLLVFPLMLPLGLPVFGAIYGAGWYLAEHADIPTEIIEG